MPLPSEKKVKVLMVSMALQGHINPMLKFAKLLISRGVHVTIVTTEEGRRRMLKAATLNNPDDDDNNNSGGIELEFFSDGLAVDFDRSDTEVLVKTTREQGPKNLRNLLTNLTKVNTYSMAVVNPFVPWAIDVITEHGIPCALLWIQACAVYSIYYRYFKKCDSFPDLEDLNEKVVLPGLPPMEVRDLPSFMLPSSPIHFKQLMAYLFEAMEKVECVLGASFTEIEEEIVNSLAPLTVIKPIGPLVSPFLLGEKENSAVSVDMWNAEDSCLEWLDGKPCSSVIYISFGSILVLSQEQLDNIATALKNTQKPFLWVLKPPERGGYNNNNPELPKGFLEETKERGLVVKWCPQEKVLMHPAVACFVSHCGWNSTLETVVTGVPVIAWPSWTDQCTNAMLIAKVFKNGVKVNCGEGGIASVEEIERCIREVTEGESAGEMKKRALEMKESARKALREGGTSENNVNEFISGLVAGNNPARA